MKITTGLVYFGISLMTLHSAALAVELHCPASITVSQTVVRAPSTWLAANSERAHPLRGAGFTSGPPSEMAFLKPDSVTNKGKVSVVITTVGGQVMGGDWLNCIYEDTVATVAQPLPKDLKECSVIHESSITGRKLKSIQCK